MGNVLGSEVIADRDGVQIINQTTIDDRQVMNAFNEQHPELAALVDWSNNIQRRAGGIFERDRYLTPRSIFSQFSTALDAAETDDIVSGVLETTESLAFSNMSIECEDPDEEDVWNQIIEDIDLYARTREMWRELFIISQFYAATFWVNKDYKVRGKTSSGNKKRKSFSKIKVPGAVSILDPLKVVPVGNFLFGQEQLAYIADRSEAKSFNTFLAGPNSSDLVVSQLLAGAYKPDQEEKKYLQQVTDRNMDYLFLLNPKSVWRHTATRPSYQRFATVRMKSVFEILDIKQQLRQADRSHLIGNALRCDQKVMTPTGWKTMGSLSEGDSVFGVDGLPVRVTGVYPQGVAEVYEVEFQDGSKVVCDDRHLWTVMGRRGNLRTLPLSDIVREGLMDKNGTSATYRHRIPMTQPVQFQAKEFNIHPYLMGYMLGDGSFSQSSLKVASAEEENLWMGYLPSGFSVVNHEKREGFCPQYLIRGPAWRNNELIDIAKEKGLWGKSGASKFIPSEYLYGSVAQRIDLLRGLMDSDGSNVGSGCAEFSNISLDLINGVKFLVESLGGAAKISERPTMSENHQQAYRLHISLNGDINPFALKRKADAWVARKYQYNRAIKSVTKLDTTANTVCIKVDREDGLFLTESFVVTHNTNFIVLVKKGNDMFPAKPAEVQSLANQVKMAARVPVIVGDHRIEVEIVTPKMDFTLIPEKYNTLDARLTARLFQILMTGNYAAGASGDDSIKLARVVARGMEARRQMIGASFFKNVIMPTMRANPDVFTTLPQLHFHPKRIALDFDPNVLAYYQELRDRGDLSRETILSEMDIDQEQEYRRRTREKEKYDETFKPPMALLLPGAPGGPPAPPPPPVQPGAPKAPAKPAAPASPAKPKAPGSTGTTGNPGKTAGGKTAGRSGGRKGGTNRDSFKSGPPRGANKADLDGVEISNLELDDDIFEETD